MASVACREQAVDLPAGRAQIPDMRPHLLLASLLGLLLPSCAPVAMLRPPVPMPEGAIHEVGGGASYLVSFEDGEPLPLGEYNVGPSVQLWYDHHFSERFSGGLVGYVGMANLAGVGVQLRYLAVTRERFRLGVDAAGGIAWAEAGVPLAVRLAGRTWLYTAPSAGWSVMRLARLPIGLSIPVGEKVLITPEIAVRYGMVSRDIFLGYPYEAVEYYAALGSTYRF